MLTSVTSKTSYDGEEVRTWLEEYISSTHVGLFLHLQSLQTYESDSTLSAHIYSCRWGNLRKVDTYREAYHNFYRGDAFCSFFECLQKCGISCLATAFPDHNSIDWQWQWKTFSVCLRISMIDKQHLWRQPAVCGVGKMGTPKGMLWRIFRLHQIPSH